MAWKAKATSVSPRKVVCNTEYIESIRFRHSTHNFDLIKE
jgi:hypothetical protein